MVIIKFKLDSNLQNTLNLAEKINQNYVKKILTYLLEIGRNTYMDVCKADVVDGMEGGEHTVAVDTYILDNTGFLVVSGKPVAFIEFGTGVVGEESAHNPLQPSYWIFDYNNHGTYGWVYFDTKQDKLHLTRGQTSANRPLFQAITAMRFANIGGLNG